MKFKPPTSMAIETDDGTMFVRFDYDPGEEQWFDARQGYGSPGCDPSVCVTEVRLPGSSDWCEPLAAIEDAGYWESVEQEIMERLDDMQRDEIETGYERLAQQIKDDKLTKE